MSVGQQRQRGNKRFGGEQRSGVGGRRIEEQLPGERRGAERVTHQLSDPEPRTRALRRARRLRQQVEEMFRFAVAGPRQLGELRDHGVRSLRCVACTTLSRCARTCAVAASLALDTGDLDGAVIASGCGRVVALCCSAITVLDQQARLLGKEATGYA